VRSRQLYGCACEEQALLHQSVVVEICEEQIVEREACEEQAGVL
jgi:hypothetical protein